MTGAEAAIRLRLCIEGSAGIVSAAARVETPTACRAAHAQGTWRTLSYLGMNWSLQLSFCHLIFEWAWRKRKAGASWGTIKDALRTMQRVLSAHSNEGKPPFSLRGLRIPKRDKLQMKIHSRKKVSYSWVQALQIANYTRKRDDLRERERYAVMVLLESASGVRSGELLALRINDVDFEASTVRVDEALPRKGEIGPCKNAAAYRTVLLHDAEGQKAMRELKRFLGQENDPDALVFGTKHGTPNRRWELAGINPAVLRHRWVIVHPR